MPDSIFPLLVFGFGITGASILSSTGIDLYGIAHVKVDFIPVLKMCVIRILGKFV